jgi:2'-5' RNA ligase
VPEANLHVTLVFLGERDPGDVAAIADVLAGCTGAAPELEWAGTVALPPRRPRVLAVRLREGGDELARLQACVAGGLAARGLYAPEHRPFLAHVTVARARRGGAPDRRHERRRGPSRRSG